MQLLNGPHFAGARCYELHATMETKDFLLIEPAQLPA